MDYTQFLNAINDSCHRFYDATGATATVIHVHPLTFRELYAAAVNSAYGSLYVTPDGTTMFMGFRVEQDSTVPVDTLVMNDSLMYGCKIMYDALKDVYIVYTVRPDGSSVSAPYYAPSHEKVVAKARSIALTLGHDYYSYQNI